MAGYNPIIGNEQGRDAFKEKANGMFQELYNQDENLADRGFIGNVKNISNTDINNLLQTGFYGGTNLTNAPSAGYWYIEVISYNGTNLIKQKATRVTGASAGEVLERICDTTWKAWREIPAIETGIWTPVLRGHTTAGTNTYSEQVGTYVKIGKLIAITFGVALSAKDVAMAGVLRITGLPFVINPSVHVSGAIGSITKVDLNTGYTSVALVGIKNTANIEMYQIGDNITAANIPTTAIGSDFVIYGSMTYQTS